MVELCKKGGISLLIYKKISSYVRRKINDFGISDHFICANYQPLTTKIYKESNHKFH